VLIESKLSFEKVIDCEKVAICLLIIYIII